MKAGPLGSSLKIRTQVPTSSYENRGRNLGFCVWKCSPESDGHQRLQAADLERRCWVLGPQCTVSNPNVPVSRVRVLKCRCWLIWVRGDILRF